MRAYLEKLVNRENLTSVECGEALEKMDNDAQTGAFLSLLRAKGETVEELLGFIRALRQQAEPFGIDFPVLEIVGTGGDRAGTVNISTGSSLLAARCGIPVVKHGGRSVSSSSGSADVLEALGFSFDHPKVSLEKTGFAFCFAGKFYPTMVKIRPVRQGLKIPTLFNLVCPLLNPAGISHVMVGVYKPELVPLIAETLFRLGTKRSLVFHGFGLDELTCLGTTNALLVTEKEIVPLKIDPVELGLKLCAREDLKGGDAQTSAMLIGAALTGSSPLSDTLALNAGIGVYLFGKAGSMKEGVKIAKAAMQRKSLKKALSSTPNAVLAEIKRASPARGKIGDIPDPASQAMKYVQGGAAAISVLTCLRFDGTLEDLGAVVRSLAKTRLPVLRKDFILEPIHIAQAAAHGADAVLLIATFLKERTQEMMEMAKKIGLEAVVEVHDPEELRYFQGAEIIAVNQRNLSDFSMHPEIHDLAIGKIPSSALPLAVSGIASAEEAKRLFQLGYRALLIGEALTRSNDPAQFLRSITCS
jgi:anthranilate phosphoribosyltransferase